MLSIWRFTLNGLEKSFEQIGQWFDESAPPICWFCENSRGVCAPPNGYKIKKFWRQTILNFDQNFVLPSFQTIAGCSFRTFLKIKLDKKWKIVLFGQKLVRKFRGNNFKNGTFCWKKNFQQASHRYGSTDEVSLHIEFFKFKITKIKTLLADRVAINVKNMKRICTRYDALNSVS